MASYVPRYMVGTILIHVGIDIFLEAFFDCEFTLQQGFKMKMRENPLNHFSPSSLSTFTSNLKLMGNMTTLSIVEFG